MNKRLAGKVISLALIMVMALTMVLPASASELSFDRSNEIKAQEIRNNISSDLINYIAITSSNQSLRDEQQVVVGIGNGNKNLKDGVLTYKNISTGDIYQVARDDKSEDAMSFTIDYEGKSLGIYQLVGLEYTLDGQKNNIALSDVELAVSWGVGVEYNSNPDNVINLDSLDEKKSSEVADVSFDVTTSDGKTSAASNIEDALKAASGELSISDNGVVNTKASYESASRDEKILSESGLSVSSNDVINTGAGNVVVVLDPGHGGYDSGATYNGLLEKDVNLRVATYCKSFLEQYGGITVYMTRYDDTAPGYPVNTDLVNRVNYAQSVGATAFVSIHMNSGGGKGVEVYYPNANYNPTVSEIGRNLSYCIYNNIVALGMNARGVKIRNSSDGSGEDYYSVIRNSKERGFPGIIVEHGFMDGDYDKLSNDNFLRQLGEADARGIAQYFGLSVGEDLAQYEGAFNANAYRTFYPDVSQLDDQQCFKHWIDYGIMEGRDGSPVFNMSCYMENNSELFSDYGFDFRSYARHFSQKGMAEGRTSIDSFSLKSYMNRYVDLRNAFGKDYRSYYMHYNNFGWQEGRETTGYDDQRVGTVTRIWVVDFTDVYDYDYYVSHYPDIKAAFGDDDIEALYHFAFLGLGEGRQAIDNFNIVGYKNRNLDLRRAFGNDLLQYVVHYTNYGRSEGRDASYAPQIMDPEHVFWGVDFSPVYDFNYYVNHNDDLKSIFANDDIAAFNHFLMYGINEGRMASPNFNVWAYASNNEDLRNAFGWNLSAYYLHYIQYGRSEGRIAV